MSLLSKLKNIFKRSTSSSPDQWFIDWVRGGESTSSGVSVTEQKAMKYSPFWAAVRVISGTLGFLPFFVYKRDGDDRERVNHPAFELLHNRPNEYMDALTFKETRQAHALTYGNGYAEIQRNGAGKPVALWPLLPDRTWRRITESGLPYYEVRTPTGEKFELPDENVLHIKGLGFDGYTGYNVVEYMREAVGYGIAVKEYAGRFFDGDATPGGVLSHPEQLTKTAQKNLYDSWEKRHSGLSTKHRLQILEEGMQYTPIGVSPEQAQSLEVQKYTVDDCARIFNIPPHKLGSMDRATFSNIEEQNLDFISSTMMYWFKKWEGEANYKLLSPSQQKNYFCEILAEGLLRGRVEQRTNAYAKARQWGWMSVNDIRRLENMNSIGPDGDIYLEPMNMKPAGEEIEPAPAPVVDEEELDRMHFKLIANEFKRVITAGQRCNFKKDQRHWAETIMIHSVDAYASVRGKDVTEARLVLRKLLDHYVCKGEPIDDSYAEIVAKRIIEEVGGKKNDS
jgi:HK97 family phage portal protein